MSSAVPTVVDAIIIDLLPHPTPSSTLPICPGLDASMADAPVAAGVFVESSRSFNHSCAPDAVPLFVFSPNEPPRMEVVVVSAIQQGEEITIPYVDPALDVRTRQERLRTSYGFDCTCLRCTRELALPHLRHQSTRTPSEAYTCS
ncbi:hypothetical protein EXIGLDRAFT_769444 [Exidia glandulosa HHB12029]|uniref:SET domain-containing protein n=1 Tax=Exidia glandulosa HHB12029 TaxID=1314781 RepID=A0A165HGQ5_EXIGL|nr:hypothetical protein EXIGLDRAFT_769444 [Exidia glandulosa HHB12029]